MGKRYLFLFPQVVVDRRRDVARFGGFATRKISAHAPADRHARKRRKREQRDVVAGFRKSEWPGCGFVGAFAVRSAGCIGVFSIGGELLYLRDGRYVVIPDGFLRVKMRYRNKAKGGGVAVAALYGACARYQVIPNFNRENAAMPVAEDDPVAQGFTEAGCPSQEMMLFAVASHSVERLKVLRSAPQSANSDASS